jgi:hypothetical protein
LDDTQLLLQNDRDNGHLLMLDKQKRLNLVNLKSAEKMFFGQKLKCDKGTRFFHSLMSQRHRRNHIPAILRSDSLPTTSIEEVSREFVTYYKELLGTPKPTLPPSVAVVHCGPCINTDSHGFLLARIIVDDIKQALFNMGDDKAPSPNRYTPTFLKKAWNIVGGEFCSAIQDFFASGEILKQINHSTIPCSKISKCKLGSRLQTHFLL